MMVETRDATIARLEVGASPALRACARAIWTLTDRVLALRP